MFSDNENRDRNDRNPYLGIFPRESQKLLQKVVLVCHVEVIVVLAWKGPEMEYFNAFLIGISWHKLELFVLFSTLIFQFYKMLFMNKPELSFFADFL